MQKKMTITLDEKVVDALYRRVGRRKMSRYIEEAVSRQLFANDNLEALYEEMAADRERNAEIDLWNQATDADDFTDAAW